MMRRAKSAVLLPLVLTATLAAQNGAGHDALQSAIAVEEIEHNLAGAIESYRAVATAASHDVAVRTQAWLRLGEALRQAGDEAAAREALQQAAAGTGSNARRAAALLGGQDPDDELQARIAQAVARLGRDKTARHDLVWIGEPAVPALLDAWTAATNGSDVTVLEAVAYALLRIGDARCIQWLDRVVKATEASETKLAVIEAHDGLIDEAAISDRLQVLIEDPDPRVRVAALDALALVIPAPRVIARAADPSARVRHATLRVLVQQWPALRHEASEQDSAEQLVPALLAALADTGSPSAREAGKLLMSQAVLSTPTGRRGLLRALRIPGLSMGRTMPLFEVGPTEHLADVLALARELRGREDEATRLLRWFVASCLDDWSAEAFPTVVELWDLGFGHQGLSSTLMLWAKDGPSRLSLLQRIDRCPEPRLVFDWLVKGEMPEGAYPLLAKWWQERPLGDEGSDFDAKFACARAMIAANPTVATQALLASIEGRPKDFYYAAEALVDPSVEPPVAVLLRLMTMAGYDPNVRSSLFRRALELGASRAAAPQFARAYELGLYGGLSHLDSEVAWSHWEPADLAAVVEACLDVGVTRDQSDRRRESPRDEVRKLIKAGAWRAWPRELVDMLFRRANSRGSIGVDVAAQLVAARAPGYAEFVQQTLVEGGPSLATALTALPLMPAERLPQPLDLVRFAGHPNDEVVDRAMKAVAALDPDQAPRFLSAALEHPNENVRRAACEQAGTLVALETVPGLLKAMHDPGTGVRAAAMAALDTLWAYEQQAGRWRRLQGASGLPDPTSAAEALVGAARDTSHPERRLAAIASLGALGMPETAPFLLELWKDPDPDVAAAARAALAKINGTDEGK
ncbi:MAG: HEAT repeat domain-containing protein [Planctomycetota bacterium]